MQRQLPKIKVRPDMQIDMNMFLYRGLVLPEDSEHR